MRERGTMADTQTFIDQGGNGALAALFLDYHDAQQPHDGTAWFRDPDNAGPCDAIDPNKIEVLALALQDFIANVIAAILDAGSERDAVNENNLLFDAISNELKDWVAK